jgi:porin
MHKISQIKINDIMPKLIWFVARSIMNWRLLLVLLIILLNVLVSRAQENELQTTTSVIDKSHYEDTAKSVRNKLEKYGLSSELWVTQIYQGIIAGDNEGISRYGGKTDGFLKIEPAKFGILRGFTLETQYEHYFGLDVNRQDDALLAVNTAQAYLRAGGYHSALSLVATQKLDENLSISVGKFNLLTMASKTPLIGGGGLNTFMNRAFALPSTGVAYTSAMGGPGDRVVLSPPYSLGGQVELKNGPYEIDLYLVDPRSAQSPRVIQRPFEVGVAFGAGIKINSKFLGLNGSHTLRGAYSNANGINLNTVDEFNGNIRSINGSMTKNGYYFASYLMTQNIYQSIADPEKSWGLFALYTISDGNPTPIKWSMFSGLAGNNLLVSREEDRWGIGFYHYGVSQQLLTSLQQINDPRRSETGVEAFYNIALNKFSYLSADLQIISPWVTNRPVETISAIRMQSRF